MATFKGINIPDKLLGLIEHMHDLERSREEISVLGQQWDLLTILGQMSGSGTSMANTRESFHQLTEQLLGTLGIETLKKTTQTLNAQAQVAVDIVIRNLFERTADIGFLATDEDIREHLKKVSSNSEDILESQQNLRARFADYVAKYSVYNNIVLLSPEGRLICSLREDLTLEESKDAIILDVQNTTKDYVETFRKTDLNPFDDQSLLYSYRVTETNDKSSKVLGVLCLVFKFQDELEMVFNNLVKETDWNVVALLDARGIVIASSEESQIPIGSKVSFDAEKEFHISKYGGRLYLSRTCRTKGYQGYHGLGWFGHAMVPLEYAFKSKDNSESERLSDDVILAATNNDQFFSQELRDIPLNAKTIQKNLDRTVWNGNVREESGSSDNSASARKVLLREISATGNKTRSIFEKSITRLHETAVSSIFSDAAFASALAIDIMDRNLYERANDCRWWSLTTAFRRILTQKTLSDKDVEHCTAVLKYINGLYTVYSNLFLFDVSGKIIAVSNSAEKRFVGKVLTDDYIKTALSDPSSQSYSVSAFRRTELYGDRHTYIYASSVASIENPDQVVGGIGIIFDSEPQFRAMLEDSLPKDADGHTMDGHYAMFVNREHVVIASTDPRYQVGSEYKMDIGLEKLKNGHSHSVSSLVQEIYHAVGSSCSKGYREYKSASDKYKNDIFGIVSTALGPKSLELEHHSMDTKSRVDYGPRIVGAPVKEFATFMIGNAWLGFEKKHVVECVDLGHATPIPGTPKAVIGTILFQNQPVCIVDISRFIENESSKNQEQVIIVKVQDTLYGFLVDELGDMPEVPESFLTKGDILGQMNHDAIEYLVRPAPGDDLNRMLIVMDPERFLTAVLSEKTMAMLPTAAQEQQQIPTETHLKASGE